MAKISELKFQLNGEDFKLPINVGVDGMFKCKLPQIVTDRLKLRSELRHNTLANMEAEFFDALKKYQNAETKHEFFIAIRYGAYGEFVPTNENGFPEFGQSSSSNYTLNISFGGIDALGFRYRLICKESMDSVVEWYEAIQDDITKELYKGNSKFYDIKKYKIIEYNDVYVNTLKNAHDKIKSLSTLLFRFVEQDAEKIQITLSNGKLIS